MEKQTIKYRGNEYTVIDSSTKRDMMSWVQAVRIIDGSVVDLLDVTHIAYSRSSEITYNCISFTRTTAAAIHALLNPVEPLSDIIKRQRTEVVR